MTSSLTRVQVSNYQSIGSADVAIGGLTVLVGRGNLGKSAFLRALCACLFNETGTGFIRSGEKKSTVTLSFEGDQSVMWTKDDKTARYDVDIAGATIPFTKLAGNVPEELQDMFGVRTIEIDKTFSIRPQVHGQFDAPLLLAESAGKAARALAKLTKLEVVLAAQQASARDLRASKQTANARTREVDELTVRMSEFPDIDAVDVALRKARGYIEQADGMISDLARAEDVYAAYQSVVRRLEVAPPDIGDLDKLTERLVALERSVAVRRRFVQAQAEVASTRQMVKDGEVQEEKTQKAHDEYLADLGVCPACGQVIGEDHAD